MVRTRLEEEVGYVVLSDLESWFVWEKQTVKLGMGKASSSRKQSVCREEAWTKIMRS